MEYDIVANKWQVVLKHNNVIFLIYLLMLLFILVDFFHMDIKMQKYILNTAFSPI